MHNKKHTILDDVWDMKEEFMGGPEQTLRVGLITNTVMNSTPVQIPDIRELLEVPKDTKVDFNNLAGLPPILLGFSHKSMQISVLLVLDKDSGHIQCYPFSNINEEGKWWAYEVAFDLTPDDRIEIRPVHPLAQYADPTKEMMDHLEILATVCSVFISRLQNEDFELVEEMVNYSKINKKRAKQGKALIENNWIPTYVSKNDSKGSTTKD